MSNQFLEKSKIADVRDVNILRKTNRGDMVINFAAVHRDDGWDKLDYQCTNVDGAENLALIYEGKSINNIVFTSIFGVYGFAEPRTD